jgi:hypothetical protein
MASSSFFSSPQFLASAIVALLVLAGGAAAYAWIGPGSPGGFGYAGDGRACDPIPLSGAPLATPAPSDETSGGVRTIAYALPTDATRASLLAACSTVGDVAIAQATGTPRVVFTIRSDDADALADTNVTLALARTADGALQLAAWESRAGTSRDPFQQRGSSVDVRIEVPEWGAPDVRARSDVGDVLVSQLLVGNMTLRTDVGRARAVGVDITGNVSMQTNVHDVELRAASIQSGRVTLRSDVGTIVAALPARADVGYDVTAKSDVGDVSVNLGPTELYQGNKDGGGGDVHARSQGYDGKPTKVVLEATSNVGAINITAG